MNFEEKINNNKLYEQKFCLYKNTLYEKKFCSLKTNLCYLPTDRR